MSHFSKMNPYGGVSLAARNDLVRHAVVYVTDAGFALPSAASAIAVRRSLPASVADVYIVTVDVDDRAFEGLSALLDQHQVSVVRLKDRSFSSFNTQLFNKTHVPISSVARFFLLDALPRSYERILYLDGDVWPRADLGALLAMDIPSGMIAAAEDTLYYCRNDVGDHGNGARAYFAANGIDPNAGYFNAGVLLADSQSLREIFRDAFAYFMKHTSACRYHDQSALNATTIGRRVRLSPKWNFLTVYCDWGVAPASDAKLMHFAGGFKPWTIPSPYYPGVFEVYRAAFETLESTGLKNDLLGPEEALWFKKRLRRDWVKMRTVALPRRLWRRHEYRMLDKTALR
jgi:lipopolysaccharide biosynthesis glycosyltransferase